MQNSKKKVVITSLAMRFYESHGWTLKLLKKYLKSGDIVKKEGWPQLGVSNYFILDVGSSIDIDRLYEDGHIGEVMGKYDYLELFKLSDKEALKERNW